MLAQNAGDDSHLSRQELDSCYLWDLHLSACWSAIGKLENPHFDCVGETSENAEIPRGPI